MRRTGRNLRTSVLAVFLALGLGACAIPSSVVAAPQLRYDREYPSIAYSTRERTDRVAKLRTALESGSKRLEFGDTGGYLESVLEALDIPVSSQMLVFTGQSLQGNLISPQRPRAIYFNDDTFIAFVQGSDVLEISAIDPVMGGVFYSMTQDPGSSPELAEESDLCLACHDSFGLTGGGAPRHLVGSMLPDRRGRAVTHEGWSLTDDRTPLRRRWGGWYVTGTHGDQTHLGNVMVRGADEVPELDLSAFGNRTSLEGMLNLNPYLTGHSDIVALMVLEHQVHVQNLITRLNYDARNALLAEGEEAMGSGRRLGEMSEDVLRVLEASGEPLLRGLLLLDEASINDQIEGTSGYAGDFEAMGPHDTQGRSLRDLDLRERLFTHPLSYLIYSTSFGSMPDVAREYVYRRLDAVLSGEDTAEPFAGLAEADRAAVFEILRDTSPEFAGLIR